MSACVDSAAPIRILYIAGTGRSGSTLLDRYLGGIDGFASVGEARHLLLDDPDWLCGCWLPICKCDFWAPVILELERAREAGGPEARESLQRAHEKLIRNWRLAVWRKEPWSFRDKDALRTYSQYVQKFYRAIQSIVGDAWVVDSSKSAALALLLSAMPNVDVRVAHLIRDPRGVANSMARVKRKPEITNKVAYLDSAGVVRSALQWNVANRAAEVLSDIAPYHLVRYEDFVLDPLAAARALLDGLGIQSTALKRRDSGGKTTLPVQHTVSGNPMRMQGALTIRPDFAWKRELPKHKRFLVAMLTARGRKRYGYWEDPWA